MPWRRNSDNYDDDASERPTLGERLRKLLLKPVPEGDPGESSKPAKPAKPPTVEEIEASQKTTDDKERIIGLLGAPFATAIGFLIITARIDNDPAAIINGVANKQHVSVSLYHELLVVFLVLALLMLVMAWFRKRLYLGIVMALYGLAVFNLGYWGFGVPFVLAGAWLLVRAYRIQQRLKEATAGGPSGRSNGPGPRANKRFTPPTSPRRSTRPKPEDEQKAG
jgi:hypothetical protein